MYKLSVDELHKKYGDHEVLKGVSLKAKAGDVISIIGSSGSGKSTFLRCINFLEQPCAGTITVNNEQIRTKQDLNGALRVDDLTRLRVPLRKALPFLLLPDHVPRGGLDNPARLRAQLAPPPLPPRGHGHAGAMPSNRCSCKQ